MKTVVGPGLGGNGSGSAFDWADGGALFDGDGFLALAAAEVVEAGATDFAEADDFNFGDLWGVEREDAFDAFAIRDFADGVSGVEAGAFAGDDEAGVDLNTLFVTFDNAAVHFDGVSHTEFWDVRFELLLFEFGNDVHGVLSGWSVACKKRRKLRGVEDAWMRRLCKPKFGFHEGLRANGGGDSGFWLCFGGGTRMDGHENWSFELGDEWPDGGALGCGELCKREWKVMDWASIRGEFPILQQRVKGGRLIYLDNAATSQKPRAVIEAMSGYYECDNANVHRGMHELSGRATAAYEGAREKVARYLGAGSAEEIVFTRGTTEAINLVAQVFGSAFLQAGDVILLTEMEHHSNLVPWQLVAARCGARMKHIPVKDDGTLDLEAAAALFAEGGVKVAAFTHISNTLGTVNPVVELCRMAKEAGAVSLVDGAQSAGHLPVDVRALGCDFYAFSGHKMCGPTGIGALYGRKEWLERMPPWHGGGEMISVVRRDGSEFKPPPMRFEAGTPNIGGAVGLGAAIDFIESIGREAIWEHDQVLTQHLLGRLGEVPGIRVLGQAVGVERGAVAAFTTVAAHPHDLVTFADERGLALRGGHHCNQPLMRRFKVPSTARASVYFYNTLDEVDEMIDIVQEAVRFFGGLD